MAHFIGDGFDVYEAGGVAQPVGVLAGFDVMGGSGTWTTSFGTANLTNTTPFGVGKSIQWNTSGNKITKTGGPNSSTWFAAFRNMQTVALSGSTARHFVQFSDGATAQVTISFRSDGAIVVRSGGTGGTVQATFTSAFVANSFDHWQYKVVIHDTAGEVHIRKAGAASDTFSATAINTRGGTSNNYANAVTIGESGGGSGHFMDDFICFDSAGAAPNDWVGDVRAIQLPPLMDTAQKQFAQASTGSLSITYQSGSVTQSRNADTLYVGHLTGGFRATQGGSFTSITVVFNAGFTGHAKLAIYMADGDVAGFTSESQPGRLIAVSDAVTNPSASQAFSFASAVPIQNRMLYYGAILTDAAFTSKAASSPTNIYTTGVSYAGGFPTSLIGVTADSITATSGFNWSITLTADNAGCVSDELQDGATTFLYDSTVGHYDLSDLRDLPYVPAAIIGVNVRSYVSKSDAGARGAKMVLKSGGAEYRTAEYSPLTTPSNFNNFYALDPASNALWTITGINALQIGPEVSS